MYSTINYIIRKLNKACQTDTNTTTNIFRDHKISAQDIKLGFPTKLYNVYSTAVSAPECKSRARCR